MYNDHPWDLIIVVAIPYMHTGGGGVKGIKVYPPSKILLIKMKFFLSNWTLAFHNRSKLVNKVLKNHKKIVT
jgi:hypothetical protein